MEFDAVPHRAHCSLWPSRNETKHARPPWPARHSRPLPLPTPIYPHLTRPPLRTRRPRPCLFVSSSTLHLSLTLTSPPPPLFFAARPPAHLCSPSLVICLLFFLLCAALFCSPPGAEPSFTTNQPTRLHSTRTVISASSPDLPVTSHCCTPTRVCLRLTAGPHYFFFSLPYFFFVIFAFTIIIIIIGVR